jgi:AcrR family transcriptional regulator
MPENDERRQQILNVAAAVIIRQGYDKTTMNDIADEAGLSRSTVYVYFNGKEELFEALVFREFLHYGQTWAEYIEADPRGGTIGGIYRAVLFAINSRPFMAAMMRRDRRIIGSYLRKPDNLFTSMQSSSFSTDFLRALQEAGTVRKDVDPVMTAHIMDTLSFGQLTIGDFRAPDEVPSYDNTMEAIGEMWDRLLTPEDGGNSEAGKAVIRQLATQSRAQFEQMKQAKDKKEAGE